MFNNSSQQLLESIAADEIILYLRKSRQDDPAETVEQVLARHEMQLQDFSVRTFGDPIQEKNIYREVVSGETIDDRPEIQKLLGRIQDSGIKAVLVIEPQRLTRGDLLDCGTIVHALRYTHTVCITPSRSYNLDDKYDRRYFEDELKRGNDYLEYIKEILDRGRRASTMQGYWVMSKSPFGYDRVMQKNKKFILVPNENAPHVRMIFEQFADGMGYHAIAVRLNQMGIRAPGKRGSLWLAHTVKALLQNDVYVGRVRFGCTRLVRIYQNGRLKKKQIPAPSETRIIAKGLHTPIISSALWERVQAKCRGVSRAKANYALANPLAGLLVCQRCGHVMRQYRSGNGRQARFACYMAPQCQTKSVLQEEVMSALTAALRSDLPQIEEKPGSGVSSGREARRAQLATLEFKLKELQAQEEYQYDLLERKEYSPEVFSRRHARLAAEISKAQAAIEMARQDMSSGPDDSAAPIRLRDAISALENPNITALEKNNLLKAVIDHIEYDREKGEARNPFALHIYLRI